MPMPSHMTIKTAAGKDIQGSCKMKGRENTILIFSMDHDIHMPRDPQSGLPTGKRIHGPLTIMKEFDKSSPELYKALSTGERMTVTIKWYRIDPKGKEEHYFTHELTDAIVVSIKVLVPVVFLKENEPYRHMEEVSFTYKKIKWTQVPDSKEAEDDWEVPPA